MTRYEEQFYREFSQLVSTMKEISKDIREIKNQVVPQPIHQPVMVGEIKSGSFTYGEICKMKEDFEKALEFTHTQRFGEERNDK